MCNNGEVGPSTYNTRSMDTTLYISNVGPYLVKSTQKSFPQHVTNKENGSRLFFSDRRFMLMVLAMLCEMNGSFENEHECGGGSYSTNASTN